MGRVVAYYQPLSGHVRAYSHGSPDTMEPYVSSASILWHDAHTAEFVGMFGEHMDRETVAAHVKCLFDKGAKVLTAKRVNPHIMPRGWIKVSSHENYSVWAIGRTLDAVLSSKHIGETMALQILDDKNSAVETTEIRNEAGELLVRITREYGAALPTAEGLAIEAELTALAARLAS